MNGVQGGEAGWVDLLAANWIVLLIFALLILTALAAGYVLGRAHSKQHMATRENLFSAELIRLRRTATKSANEARSLRNEVDRLRRRGRRRA